MHHVAQINIARMLKPLDDPQMADFVNNLDRINALADAHKEFVWRLKGEEDNATAIHVFVDNMLIINMSIWKDKTSLFDFTYNSLHIEVLKRKKEWFMNMTDMHMALWYIPIGHIPTPDEAKARLAFLNTHGETPYAFTFRSKFSEEDWLNFKLKQR